MVLFEVWGRFLRQGIPWSNACTLYVTVLCTQYSSCCCLRGAALRKINVPHQGYDEKSARRRATSRHLSILPQQPWGSVQSLDIDSSLHPFCRLSTTPCLSLPVVRPLSPNNNSTCQHAPLEDDHNGLAWRTLEPNTHTTCTILHNPERCEVNVRCAHTAHRLVSTFPSFVDPILAVLAYGASAKVFLPCCNGDVTKLWVMVPHMAKPRTLANLRRWNLSRLQIFTEFIVNVDEIPMRRHEDGNVRQFL